MAMLFSQAHAAGWGDLTVLSHLGQPLRADIELISTAQQDDGPLTVRLAGIETYRQANIEFNPALMSLRFAVEQRGARQFVRVTSTQPLNEPFIDMLLELSSSSGRVVREFVFLLDPAINETPAAPAETITPRPARAPAAQPSRAPATARAPAPKPAAAKPAAATAAASKPRLTLSGVTAVSATDDKAGVIALEDYATMEKQVADANARVKALEQKVADLHKLLEVTNTLLAELQKQNEPVKPGTAPAPMPAPAPSAAPAAEPAAAAPAPTAQPAPPPPKAPPKPAAPPPEDEAGYLLPGAALLAALLGAAGIYLNRRRKTTKPSGATRLDDTLHAATTTAGGGDAAHTALATAMLLPTGIGHTTHEVDPLAEADVYIAYGRDVQAEDILKEALHKQPDRHAVRVKLLSIYAGRKDLQSFDALARELHDMTKGEGEDWEQAAELGRDADPANPLYAPPAEAELIIERVAEQTPAPAALPELTPTEEISPAALEALPAEAEDEFDMPAAEEEPLPALPVPGPIDFDMSGLEERQPAIPELPVAALDASAPNGNLLDFDFLAPETGADTVPDLPSAVLEEPKQEEVLLDLDFLKPSSGEIPKGK